MNENSTATQPSAPPAPAEPGESQLGFWGNEEEEAAVVSVLREGRCSRYSGKIALACEERARSIVRLRLLGYSYRYIERQTGADLRTVRAVELELRRQGKLPAEREELAGQYSEIARVSNERLLEALDRGKVPINILPVASGVAADKRAMLLGESAGTTVNVQVNINQDLVGALRAAIQDAMVAARPDGPASDKESIDPVIDVEALAHESTGTEGTLGHD